MNRSKFSHPCICHPGVSAKKRECRDVEAAARARRLSKQCGRERGRARTGDRWILYETAARVCRRRCKVTKKHLSNICRFRTGDEGRIRRGFEPCSAHITNPIRVTAPAHHTTRVWRGEAKKSLDGSERGLWVGWSTNSAFVLRR